MMSLGCESCPFSLKIESSSTWIWTYGFDSLAVAWQMVILSSGWASGTACWLDAAAAIPAHATSPAAASGRTRLVTTDKARGIAGFVEGHPPSPEAGDLPGCKRDCRSVTLSWHSKGESAKRCHKVV